MARHTTYDPDKVKELRMKLIEAGLAILNDRAEVKKWSQIKREFVLKAAIRALPILNAGKDDDSDLIPNPILGGQTKHGLSRNNSDKETPEAEEENP